MRQTTVARSFQLLFCLCLVSVVFPVLRVPFIDLSLTAPLFFILFGEVIMRGKLARTTLQSWKPTLVLLASGFLLSFIANSINLDVGFSHDLLLVIRYVYWIVTFAVATTIVAQTARPEFYCKTIGWTIIALAAYRLFEIVTYRQGLFAENSYGFLFSCFFAYGALLIFSTRGVLQLLACGGLSLMVLAVVLNGSRTSWITIGVQLAVVSWILLRAPRIRLRIVVLALALVGTVAIFRLFTPANLEEQISSRARTFSSLERDKSYQTRKAMVRKGLALFKESPILGVGPGRFARTMAVFEVPDALSGVPKQTLNRRSSHNSYVQMLAETGLVGSLPFFALMAALILRGLASSRRLTTRRHLWAAAVYASFIGMSIHMWTIAGLTGSLAWVVCGMVGGMISWERLEVRRLQAGQHDLMTQEALLSRRELSPQALSQRALSQSTHHGGRRPGVT